MTIREILDKLAGSIKLQPPASADAIAAFAVKVQETYQLSLPAQLAELYAIADGLDYDGLQVFATNRAPFAFKPKRSINGLLEMNEAYGETKGLEGRLIIANDNGPVLWGIDGDGGVKLVTSGGDEVATYPTLAGALAATLVPRLR